MRLAAVTDATQRTNTPKLLTGSHSGSTNDELVHTDGARATLKETHLGKLMRKEF